MDLLHSARCCSQTGSGKTLSFLLPVVALLLDGTITARLKPCREAEESVPTATASSEDISANALRGDIDEIGIQPTVLVLAPTRELCSQIFCEARKLCFRSSLRCVAVYGGSDMKDQFIGFPMGVIF